VHAEANLALDQAIKFPGQRLAVIGGDGYGIADTGFFTTGFYDPPTPTGNLGDGTPAATMTGHGTPAGRTGRGRPRAAVFDHHTPEKVTA
jgi:hypothetical protein